MLGSGVFCSGGQRGLESTSQQKIFKLQGAPRHTHGFRDFQKSFERFHCRDSQRQFHGGSLCPQQRGSSTRTIRNSHVNMGSCGVFTDISDLHPYPRSSELNSRQTLEVPGHPQLDAPSSSLSLVRQKIWSLYRRPLRVKPERATPQVQFQILGAKFGRNKRSGPGLEPREQLCQPSMGTHSQSDPKNHCRPGRVYTHRTCLPGTTMVPVITNLEGLRTTHPSRPQKHYDVRRPKSGAYEEQSMAFGGLESIWQSSLMAAGWSKIATSRF